MAFNCVAEEKRSFNRPKQDKYDKEGRLSAYALAPKQPSVLAETMSHLQILNDPTSLASHNDIS